MLELLRSAINSWGVEKQWTCSVDCDMRWYCYAGIRVQYA